MSKTEGECELVLGNRQLLSAFFIIVILLKQYLSVIKRPKMHDKSLSWAHLPLSPQHPPAYFCVLRGA
jgi:hypothetical protein